MDRFQVLAAHTLHHPVEGTLFPAKIAQAALASEDLPWNWAQVPHFCVGLNVGFAALSSLLASVTNPNALALGSLGSRGGIPAARAGTVNRFVAGIKSPAINPLLTIARRENWLDMVALLFAWVYRIEGLDVWFSDAREIYRRVTTSRNFPRWDSALVMVRKVHS
jgi:hypothetical protein